MCERERAGEIVCVRERGGGGDCVCVRESGRKR